MEARKKGSVSNDKRYPWLKVPTPGAQGTASLRLKYRRICMQRTGRGRHAGAKRSYFSLRLTMDPIAHCRVSRRSSIL